MGGMGHARQRERDTNIRVRGQRGERVGEKEERGVVKRGGTVRVEGGV